MLKLEYKDYILDFKFEAGTSRGVLKKHPVYIIKISEDGLMPFGYGEAAPLAGLSVDKFEELETEILRVSNEISDYALPKTEKEVFSFVNDLVKTEFPSLKFALETAFLDLIHKGKQLIFDTPFYSGELELSINGLVWMGEFDQMKKQLDEKLDQGFKCIKIKVGAIDWNQELELIDYLRKKSQNLMIRLDANGGFPTNEVLFRLQDLEKYDIHSVEQPIMPRQPEAMSLICEKSKTPIALDEELIGISHLSAKKELLQYIQPSFIVLKPTLLGGFHATREWIEIAESMGIGWWMTSALESNIGLNAISQFASTFDSISYQGLGTGQLYHNNIMSPLQIEGERLKYNHNLNWHMPF